MGARTLDHVNIVTSDLAGTMRFYRDLLGLEPGERPAFAFPGAWLYLDGKPVLHLVLRESAAASADTGAIDHVAFGCDDFEGTRARLDAAGVACDVRDVPGGRLRQIFLRDPNGVKVELNFAAAPGARRPTAASGGLPEAERAG